MKLTIFCLTVTFLTANARTDAQSVTISGNNLSLKSVFATIKKQTGYTFFGRNELFKTSRPVSVSVHDMPLTQVLDMVLNEQPIQYRIKGKDIILIRKEVPAVSKEAGVSVIASGEQGFPVTGVVYDAEGLPMQGATIGFKGSNKLSTVSNAKGQFEISASIGDILVISYVGYTTQEIVIKNNSPLNIKLRQDERRMNDVVVTGIVNRKAESFTGSTTKITRQELLNAGTTNVFQSLKVLEPSLKISDDFKNGSDPNKLPSMQIRGTSSFPDVTGQYATDPNLPLFIVDGFESSVQKVNDMDLNRIESVTILKDASAKAIYGSKAANGVIVIETTKVKPGELRINYTGTVNVEAPDLSSYNLTNAREKLDLENQLGAYAPTSNVPYYGLAKDSLYFANYNGVQRGVNTDWLAQPLRNGIGYKHSLDMQVGTDALLAGLTLFTGNTQGAMKGSERGTYGGAFTLVNRYKKLLFRNILEYSVTNATNSPYGDFSQYVALNPYWTPTNPDGSLKQFLGLGPVYTQQVYNPLYDAAYVSNTNKYSTLTNNTNLEYTFNPMFKLVGRFSFTNGTNGSDVFYSSKHSKFLNYTADNFYTKGSYDKTVGASSAYSSDLYLNYNKTFGRNMIFVNAGASIHEDNSTNYLFSAVGFPNDRMNDIMFANQYAPNGKPSGSSSLNREIGLLATGNYSYADRYFADFSIRRNASSQFGSNNRWGNFWSAGAGWNIHKEAFFHQLSGVITQLKLRGSMGYTGSQNFNSYQGMLLYNYYTNASYQGMLGTYLKGLANNNLQWQQRYDANVGVDMTIMNRVSIRFDRYRSTTNNLLTDITVPPSLGFSSYKENLGQLLNTGYEFKVSYRCLVNTANRSSLNVYVSGASNTNTIQKISNSLQTLNATQDKLSATSNKPLVMFKEGQSLDAIWAVRSLGIDPSNGKEIFIKADGSLTNTWDVNDKVVVGNSQPKLFGVFGANYEYKGFTLGVACRYTTGSQMYNQTLVDRVENASLNYNVDKRAYYDSWKKPGDIALYRNIGIYPTATYATSRFVQDLNEWDISSVNIGYDFYKFQWLKKVNVQRLRVMFNMNDLAQFSSIQIERGTSYPFAHVYSMSVFANF